MALQLPSALIAEVAFEGSRGIPRRRLGFNLTVIVSFNYINKEKFRKLIKIVFEEIGDSPKRCLLFLRELKRKENR